MTDQLPSPPPPEEEAEKADYEAWVARMKALREETAEHQAVVFDRLKQMGVRFRS